MKRKICVVTGTRAEYGLLHWLMKEIDNDASLKLQLAVTGAHLSPEFGLTYRMIEKDGFQIDEKVEMLLSSDSDVGIAKSMGLGLMSFAECFSRLRPDIVVGLGDRYELLSAVTAALVTRVPVAHIHGGELTQGVFDEQIRHSITKMSHLHFTAAEEYRERVIQLGEDPEHVYNVGAPALDSISRLRMLSREEFAKETGFEFGTVNFLVTFHPVTRGKTGVEAQAIELLRALDRFKDAKVIFTQSNADPDGRRISELFGAYAKRNSGRCMFVNSLGQMKYLSALNHIDALIGNSSSGLIEMPYFRKPTVNIGSRQDGRIKPDSVIDCEPSAGSIAGAISRACSPEFLGSLKKMQNPYGKPGASLRIKNILKSTSLKDILNKKFHDIRSQDNTK
ncbi:MAG TPA: UDP-N-acetylglucosamine 2-epimerase (hydrolyzing) [Lentisphaeria bacterium]|nr:MAG: UDP-N-acetyl-D-glucosamine 2-epimerase, UDP-hydrolysing [Lentisphaerae bacterium GWF2_50_93]HCE45633.1 UDP-N-acetylglucosamine 2-epimerase (hydrolyzing) [Lentisphaeria bacterium]